MAWITTRSRQGGTSYVVRWLDASGEEQQETFRTERLAKVALARRVVEEEEGRHGVAQRKRKHTVAEAVEAWLDVAASRLKPKTVRNYRRSYDLYIREAFGSRRLVAVTTPQVQAWALDLPREHPDLMPATVRHAFLPLRLAFRFAVRQGWLAADPTTNVELPKLLPAGRRKVEPHFLTLGEVEAIVAELEQGEPVDGLLVRLAAEVGLQESEIAGLRIRDLRLRDRAVQVSRSIKWHPDERRWYADDYLKSVRSARAVPILDDDLLARLAGYVERHPRRTELDAPLFVGRDRYGLDYGEPGRDHYWDGMAFYKTRFRPALRRLGLPAEPHTGVRFHDLRHTAASQWLADGQPLHEVSRWLGHSSVAFTDRVYVHVRNDYSTALARHRAARGATAEVIQLRDRRAAE